MTVIPQSLLDKLSKISGFKNVSKDNLKIIRSSDRVIMNCGTNKVMEFAIWRYSGAKFRESYITKESFNKIMEKAGK